MATSAITLRGATLTLSRTCRLTPMHSTTISAGCSFTSSKGKQRGMSIALTRYRGFHNSGEVYPRNARFPPSFNRFFCAPSETDSVVVEGSTTSATVSDANTASDPPPPSSNDPVKDAADVLDIRVGHILKAWRHPEADTLYVEEVDVGEAEPRTICSGLVKYIPLEKLQDLKVLVLANLKPRNMRGVKSNGMLLAASDASHENVELLLPPGESVVGERIWFGSEEEKENQSPAAGANQIQKKKIWELVQPHLKTDDSCVATLGKHLMRTSAGAVVCESLKNANIG